MTDRDRPASLAGAHLATRIPKMLSARTVALRLGKRRAWVYELCASGAWPGATRLGGRAWKIPEQSVLEWLASQAAAERKASGKGDRAPPPAAGV